MRLRSAILICLLMTNFANAALTQGNVTIKLAGGNYATWKAFWEDLGNLDGNITCTVDASAFTETAAPAAVTESLNGYTIHVLPASFPTKTDASDGARFTCNYATTNLYLEMEGPGTVIIEGMVFIKGTSTPSVCFYMRNINTDFTLIIRRNIVKEFNYAFYPYDSTSQDYRVYNNIFYDLGVCAIYIFYDAPSAIIANNTIVDTLGNNAVLGGDEEVIFKNNINYLAVLRCWYQIEILTEGYNNASSDATGEDADWGGGGTNNLDNIGDPFNDYANDDFTITAEGVVGTAGLNLSGDFTKDFFGTTRSNWTIGACEYVSAPPPAAGQVIKIILNLED